MTSLKDKNNWTCENGLFDHIFDTAPIYPLGVSIHTIINNLTLSQTHPASPPWPLENGLENECNNEYCLQYLHIFYYPDVATTGNLWLGI